MPKYFDGEKKLPFPITEIPVDDLSPPKLASLLTTTDKISLLIKLPNYESSCLGFVLNVKKIGSEYAITNVAGELELMLSSSDLLFEVAQHICGARYSERIHQAFAHPLGDVGRRL